jgi:hypothetical protein
MNQKWANQTKLDKIIKDKCWDIKPVDIVVGVLCKNVETTILNVLNVINEGLYRYFPNYSKAIVVSKAKSLDNTEEAVNLFQPYNSIEFILMNDLVDLGKGAGVRTIFEVAHEAQAKSVVLMDGDLLSIKPGWIESIVNPIIYGRADLTIPYYIRDKNDGVITNNLVYPFTRALYGLDIRQPIAGEYALSKNLYEKLRTHPLLPPDFGIDIFIVTVAAAEGYKVKESLFALKIHESTKRYLEPEKLLIPMFRKVTGTMFSLAEYYKNFWKNKSFNHDKSIYRECFSQEPIPVRINITQMKNKFEKEFHQYKNYFYQFLPESIISDLERIVNNYEIFDSDLWSEIVYNYASSWKDIRSDEGKILLLNTLKTLWIGRYVHYAIEVEKFDINQAEIVIQKQAEIFEEKINYLRSIYENQISLS